MESGDPSKFEPKHILDSQKSIIKTLYNKHFVKGKFRKFYDEIKLKSVKCSYCGLSETDALDHYLPKSRFPEVSIFHENLIPVCGKCNRCKADKLPVSSKNRFIHPYFDDIPKSEWLVAFIEMSEDVPVFKFEIKIGKEHIDIQEQLEFHFKNLNLYERFSIMAAAVQAELVSVIGRMEGHSMQDIKKHITSEGERKLNDTDNILESAVYFAAGKNDNFCQWALKQYKKP